MSKTWHHPKVVGLGALIAAMMVHALPVMGVPLSPGGAVSVTGLPGGSGPGVVVHDELIEFEILDAGGTFALYQGVLQSRVVRLTASGTLSFESRIRDTDGSLNGAVVRTTVSSFAGFYADVEYDSTGLGDTGPFRATRTNDGADVSFDFGPAPVLSGRESKWTFVATDAVSFAKGGRRRSP